MTTPRDNQIPLSEKERDLVRKVAQRDGITEDQAASNLVKAALARKAKKRSTGSGVRVVPIRRR